MHLHHPAVRPGAALICIATVIMLGVLATSGRDSEAATSIDKKPLTPTPTVAWLCDPTSTTATPDPCAGSLNTTVVNANNTWATKTVAPSTSSPFDCFYVYPTVSNELQDNADLAVQPPEMAAAVAQASRFSQLCNVWVPMYSQATLRNLQEKCPDSHTDCHTAALTTAYHSLRSAWDYYIDNDNHHHPIIFLGHSQGSILLTRLLRDRIDGNPKLLSQMVSAIIPGGNVPVPISATEPISGFLNIKPCRSTGQLHCVIAYSSYPTQPPPSSKFGRTSLPAMQILCTNPASLHGGIAPLDPYLPLLPGPNQHLAIAWYEYPGLFTAQCRSAGGATWLQISQSDNRLQLQQDGGPSWGYHVYDINLALGNLIQDVKAQEQSYCSKPTSHCHTHP